VRKAQTAPAGILDLQAEEDVNEGAWDAVWSAAPDREFASHLGRAGFTVE